MDIPIIERLGWLAEALSAHPYLYSFVALLFAGETIMLPIIFLALQGKLSLGHVFVVSLAATVISDSVWYALGRNFPPSFYKRFTGERTEVVMEKIGWLFKNKGVQTLVLSKFIYGTRIAAQVLSGVHRMPFALYLAANCFGVTVLMASLVILGYLIGGTVEQFGRVVHAATVAFAGFVALAVVGHITIGSFIKKKWFR